MRLSIQNRSTPGVGRRSQVRRQRALAADLSSFTSAADLLELAAIFDRHADADTADIRDAVDWTRAA